jgi:predicted TIM-barrel fold metal-dependent hydrolase
VWGALVSLNAAPAATAAIARTVGQLDGCRLLFSHLGLPGRFARPPGPSEARTVLAPLLELSRHQHVFVKLSGLYAISQQPHDFPHVAAQPFIELLLETFQPRRLLWGSDFSPALDFVSFAQTADPRSLSACSDAEIGDIMGGNLLRLVARLPIGA